MFNSFSKRWTGPALVGLAAFLWATDALVRYPAIGNLDPTFIVFAEHLAALILLLPWMVFKKRQELFSLNFREWTAAFFSGVFGSAIATVLFTASFLYVNPSVAVLLQKLQPILVVFIAYLFLGERPAEKFYLWGFVALVAGIILSFPDLNFKFLSSGVDLHSKGIQYAFGAALLWAASTVAGKILLKRTSPTVATFWRFVFGFLTLFVLMALKTGPLRWTDLAQGPYFLTLLYLSIVPGVFAILIYYSGLSRTPASITAFIELLYPIGAVLLNTFFLHTPLESIQTLAGAALVLAVAMISF